MTETDKDNATDEELKSYSIRWLILLVVSLLNLSNAMSWIALSPVANHADAFYALQDAAIYFTLIFMFVSIPFGLIAMYAERKGGLRTAILVAAWTNCIGGALRILSSYLPVGCRFYVGITGQAIAGISFAFITFLPSKVAASWFPNTQRALATTVALMSNPLGVLIANMVFPIVAKSEAELPYVNLVTGVLAAFVALLATGCVTRSRPKIPPSISASREPLSFFKGLKACLCSPQYLVLVLVVGGGIGLSNSLFALMQQLLCPSGYSNQFGGIAASLIIVGGIVGGFLSGVFVDYSRRYVETMKLCMVLAVVFGLSFLQLAIRPGMDYWILFLSFLFGSFGVASYPVGLELAAEVTYPASETTSVGLIVIIGQIQGILFTTLMKVFAKDSTTGLCTSGANEITAKDWTLSTYVISGIALSLLVVLFLFFYPEYRRSNAERGKVHMSNNGVDNKLTMMIDSGGEQQLNFV